MAVYERDGETGDLHKVSRGDKGEKEMPFLNELKDLLDVGTVTEFAEMCGKRTTNMANYLNGVSTPGRSVLEDCLLNATLSRVFENSPGYNTRLGKKAKRVKNGVVSNVFGQEIQPLSEVEAIPNRRRDLPNWGGVYILYDSAANVLYVGKAASFRAEVWQTLDREIPVGMRFGPDMNEATPIIRALASYMSLYRIDNQRLRHNIEALLIRVFINQTHNRRIGRFRTG